MGSIYKTGTDSQGRTIWRVDVKKNVGNEVKRLTGTVRGTLSDAKLLESRLLLKLDTKNESSSDVTLADYFDLVFIPGRKADGRVKATIDSYVRTFNKWIRPVYGNRYLKTITSKDAREMVAASTAQRNVLRTFRAIMNSALDDERINAPISFRRIKTVQGPKTKSNPWTAAETIEAAEILQGTGFVEFLLLAGMSGLRKEEILSLTPGDFTLLRNSDESYLLMISVNNAYTDIDGLKPTKTAESVRRVPAVIRYQDRLIEIVRSTAPVVTPLDDVSCLVERFDGWDKIITPRWRSLTFDDKKDAQREAAKLRLEAKGKTKVNTPRPQIKEVPGVCWLVRMFDGYEVQWIPKKTRVLVDGSPSVVKHDEMEAWYKTRIVACTADRASIRWKNALASRHLRHVPISSLRHFSESVQSAAGVPTSVVAKLHGHTNFSTDFTYYIDHGDAERVEAAMRVDHYLSSADAAPTVQRVEKPW